MAKVHLDPGSVVSFTCPGCGLPHALNLNPAERPCWQFSGDAGNPTIAPSINAWREFGASRHAERCHSFVRNGRIQFLPDSTHDLAGKTVDLPDL